MVYSDGSVCWSVCFRRTFRIDWWNQWRRWKESPIFVQLGKGVVVLAVLPDTPAEKLGILPGDTLMKVNGADINQAKIYTLHCNSIQPSVKWR